MATGKSVKSGKAVVNVDHEIAKGREAKEKALPRKNGPKWKPEFAEQVFSLAKLGATYFDIAQALKVALATVERWAKQNEEFRLPFQAGKKEADMRVEKALYQRAIGYEHSAKKIFCNKDGMVTEVDYVEKYPPDTNACVKWLELRNPAEWRAIQRVEHTGEGGGAIKVEELVTAPEDLVAKIRGLPPVEKQATTDAPTTIQ